MYCYYFLIQVKLPMSYQTAVVMQSAKVHGPLFSFSFFFCSRHGPVDTISQDNFFFRRAIKTRQYGRCPWGLTSKRYFWWWSALINLPVIKSQIVFIWKTAAHKVKISSILKTWGRKSYFWTLSALINLIN